MTHDAKSAPWWRWPLIISAGFLAAIIYVQTDPNQQRIKKELCEGYPVGGATCSCILQERMNRVEPFSSTEEALKARDQALAKCSSSKVKATL